MNDIEASYASLDYALLGGFFISYSVFALIQLGFLFNQQYARFISLIAAQWATIAAIKSYSFAQLVTDRASALVCNNDASGLVSLASVWIVVSLTMAGFFAVTTLIAKIRSRSRSTRG